MVLVNILFRLSLLAALYGCGVQGELVVTCTTQSESSCLSMLQSNTQHTWNFEQPSDYVSDNIDAFTFSSGQVSLQVNSDDFIDDSSGGFDLGSSAGTSQDGTGLHLTATQNNLSLNQGWAPQISSLLAHWTFDQSALVEDSADNVVDSSQNNNHGTPRGSGITTTTTSKIGDRALILDSSNSQYIDLDSKASNFSASNGTISIWVNRDFINTDAATRYIFDLRYDGSNYVSALFDPSDDTIRCSKASGGTSASISQTISKVVENTWVHLAMTWNEDEDSLKCYLSGVLVGENTSLTNPFAGTPSTMSLGAQSNGSNFWNGGLDEVGIWNDELSADDIYQIFANQQVLYGTQFQSRILQSPWEIEVSGINWKTPLPYGKPLPDGGASFSEETDSYSALTGSNDMLNDDDLLLGIQGIWHLDETEKTAGPTNDYIDSSGNDHHAENAGASFESVNSLFNKGFRVTSNTNHFIDTQAVLTAPSEGTLSFWMYREFPDNTSANQVCLAFFGPSLQMAVYYFAGQDRWYLHNVSSGGVWSTTFKGPSMIPANQWSHIVMTFDESITTNRLYVNGIMELERTNLTDETYTSIVIGGDTGMTGQGRYDEVAFWNRPLSEREIHQLYLRGKNNIQMQLRSCANADCSDQEALSGKGWKGPNGQANQFLSELHNNTSVNASGMPVGDVRPESPSISLEDLTSMEAAIGSNKYYQYRALLKSDDRIDSCTGSTTCYPTLESIEIEGASTHLNSLSYISNNNSVSYQSISSFSVSEINDVNCSIGHQLSPDNGVTYYYYSGGNWVVASSLTDSNNKDDVHANISLFSSTFPNGQFKYRAIFNSNGIDQCRLDEVTIQGNFN